LHALPAAATLARFARVALLTECRYLKERFGWAEVTEEAIDNVIDNSDSIELDLDERCKQAVRHAVGQDKAVVFACVAGCPSLPHGLTMKQVSAAQGRFPVLCR